MSDQGGGDRPRWEGFPGGVDPEQPGLPADPVPGQYEAPGQYETPPEFPVPPQFPIEPMSDETAPIPVVGTAPIDESGSGLGPRRSRSHAAPRTDTSRLVAYACAAAVVLVGAGFAFVACNNDEVSPAGTAPVVPLTAPTSSASPSATTASARPSATRTATRSPSATASPTATSSSSASATATGDVEPSPTAVVGRKQPVLVLNSTAITGLAARVAQDIENGGWTVPRTTNWTGQQPSVSTIYYLPGKKNKASAQLFADKFDVARAVKPALPGMTSNLTLVLTRDAS